ncbi:MAG: hypothetical protein K5751_00655 [Treponemataceae bacterium]|nr:hypothetical protein [Treponemataceae bacterium]
MKKPLFLFALIFVLCFVPVNAEEPSSSMDLVTDFTIWPQNLPIYGEMSDHFAPITAIYQEVELRSIFSYYYTIPVPFGTNPLVSGNNVRLVGSVELTPVSLALEPYVEFTPVAFLVFSSGLKIGTGWQFIGINGLASYDDAIGKYVPATPFGDWYFRVWMQGLFQFDLAAVLPGDWNHVVTQSSYRVMYTNSTSAESKELWGWQGSGELVDGWEFYSSIVLGYQMPLVIQMAGIQFEFSGYYDPDGIKPEYRAFKNDFTTVQINPLAIFQFNEHHSLTLMLNFCTRRAFDRAPGENETKVNLNYTSAEWIFRRIAFRYTYNF